MTATGTARTARLTRDDWVTAATTVLAGGGLAAISIEPLAAQLHATKGSFYWHFVNRDDLIAATLDAWTERYTESMIRIAQAETDPAARLRVLFDAVSTQTATSRIELNLMAAADDQVAAAALRTVTKRRVDFLARCYRDGGLDAASARDWAVLAYSSHVGLLHGQYASGAKLLRRPDRARYLEFLFGQLMSPLTAAPTARR